MSQDGDAARSTDERDIAASLNGNHDAFARLTERYQNTIAEQMRRFTRDSVRLEELVQDVFVEAFTSLDGFRGEAPFEHWLRRIAVRVGYRFWRERARDHVSGSGTDEPTPDPGACDPEELESREAAELVHQLLAELGPADRLVLTLMHLEERSVAETASLAGWSKTATKVRAHRARARLRKLLEKRGWSDE